MVNNVTLRPADISFPTTKQQTILEAANAGKVILRHGCVAGICRVCKLKLISGSIEYIPGASVCLTADEIKENYFLPCCAIAKSDLICATSMHNSGGGTSQYQKEGVVVIYKEQKGSVFILRLKLSRHTMIASESGQYIEVEVGGNVFRSYSIANIPQRDGYIELHIQTRQGGMFSGLLKNSIKLNDVLWVRGPFGSFTLDKTSKRNLLFVATGTGFSPVQSMLLSGAINSERIIHLYWGGRVYEDLFFLKAVLALKKEYINFYFHPVLSKPAPADNWKGKVGYVQNCVVDKIGCLEDFDVYACGSAAMIREAFRLFTTKCNLPADQFYSDAFYSS